VKQELEKGILEEVLTFVSEQNWNKMLDCQDLPNKAITEKAVKLAIQLTQSKIIEKIDKRIEELEKEHKKFHGKVAICVKCKEYDDKIEELQSLKKEVKP
jgi:hypothetical protein